VSDLYLYSTGTERPRLAKVHYSYRRALNKRPLCRLTAQGWPLNIATWIVSHDLDAVTCGRCLRVLRRKP